MERVYLLRMGEGKNFDKNFRGVHSHAPEEEKDPAPRQASHAMGLFEGDIFLSHEMAAQKGRRNSFLSRPDGQWDTLWVGECHPNK
jgi:hypothetical protein